MARTFSSARARSVITVLSEAVIRAAHLPTGLCAIGALVMSPLLPVAFPDFTVISLRAGRTDARHPRGPSRAAPTLWPPEAPWVPRWQLGVLRKLSPAKPAFETLTRHAHAVASAVELAG